MKKALFIHRSVGEHLLKYGNLRSLVNAKNISLDDYNNNNGLLTLNDGTKNAETIKMPGNNTNPNNLADYFSNWSSLLNDYDCILIKSCYPNSHIKDETQLEKIKTSYKSIIGSFNKCNKQLVIITTPPLRPSFTTPNEAKLASDLADWLVAFNQSNVHVFDLHHLHSEQSGKHKGMLKAEYRRILPWDNHPNRKAHRLAAPKIADLLSSV